MKTYMSLFGSLLGEVHAQNSWSHIDMETTLYTSSIVCLRLFLPKGADRSSCLAMWWMLGLPILKSPHRNLDGPPTCSFTLCHQEFSPPDTSLSSAVGYCSVKCLHTIISIGLILLLMRPRSRVWFHRVSLVHGHADPIPLSDTCVLLGPGRAE